MDESHVHGIRPSGEHGERWIKSSLARIWNPAGDVSAEPLPRGDWAMGDYVLAEVVGDPKGRAVEAVGGRMIELSEGDLMIGALGNRFATLEATGSWEDVGEDGAMDLLSGGGLLGRCRSLSTLMPDLARLRYCGHVLQGGRRQTMAGCVQAPERRRELRTPLVLITGTSMSAGKTTAARVVIRRLKRMGMSILGAKLAGAGRYRDILAMGDAGADRILDFVDAGLPSTNCGEEEYQEALTMLLTRMASVDVDVAVVEIGASPLEPYNGELAISAIRELIAINILCASDPYAVAGALQAYDLVPDFVTGTTSNTEAGVQLVERLTGLRAMDLRRRSSLPQLDRILATRLEAG
jgi:hypothetical protein